MSDIPGRQTSRYRYPQCWGMEELLECKATSLWDSHIHDISVSLGFQQVNLQTSDFDEEDAMVKVFLSASKPVCRHVLTDGLDGCALSDLDITSLGNRCRRVTSAICLSPLVAVGIMKQRPVLF